MNFTVPADYRKKIKESEKRKKRKLFNMKVTVIPIVTGALGTVLKDFERRLEELKIKGQIENIQTTEFFRLVIILRMSWSFEKICYYSDSS